MHKTPILTAFSSSSSCKAVFIKLENTQVNGSFKSRGALLLVDELIRRNRRVKMVTMSAGNFGRSFAAACKQHGIAAGNAVVCMPDDVPKDRVLVCEGFGVKVRLCGRQQLMNVVKEYENDGYTFVHPFDDELLFKGYSSIARELLEDLKEFDVLICGVGGGGLLAGIASELRLSNKFNGKIFGVEPVGASKMYQSLQRDQPVTLDKIDTFVNGLAAPFAGPKAFQLIKKHVDSIVLVTDDEVREAMKVYFNDYKQVVEPAGAASLAALLFGKIPMDLSNKRVVIIASGGNISITQLHDEISKISAKL